MALLEVTEKVLQLVEQTTGLPVVVNTDPAMKTLASVKIARGSAPAHFLTYNPTLGANVNYAICFQCGFVLRTYLAPEPERYGVGSTFRGRKEAEKLVNDHVRDDTTSNLNRDARMQLASQFYDGLIRQLRSIPVALRVDDWIRRDYPDLVDEQRVVANRQLHENTAALKPEVKRFAPAKIFQANAAMNAAFAAFWARAWNDPLMLLPYKATGHQEIGETLLNLWDEIPADPANDKRLIDTWGNRLGLTGWYEFVPHGQD